MEYRIGTKIGTVYAPEQDHHQDFRCFKALDVKLGDHAVILGENKVGKTNDIQTTMSLVHRRPDNAIRTHVP